MGQAEKIYYLGSVGSVVQQPSTIRIFGSSVEEEKQMKVSDIN